MKSFTANNSSTIASVTFDDLTNDLFVEFTNGAIYKYDRVPETIFEAWKNAESAGSYFNTEIRNRYIFTKVKDKKYIPTDEEKQQLWDDMVLVAETTNKNGKVAFVYEIEGKKYLFKVSKAY